MKWAKPLAEGGASRQLPWSLKNSSMQASRPVWEHGAVASPHGSGADARVTAIVAGPASVRRSPGSCSVFFPTFTKPSPFRSANFKSPGRILLPLDTWK